MRIGLVVNPQIQDAIDGSYKIIDFLKENVDLTITDELSEIIKDKYDVTEFSVQSLKEFDSENLEMLVTIGGDGTILRALHNCKIKVFGINAGVVGFLTEVHLTNAIESLKRILNNDYEIDQRVRLKTMLNSDPLEPATNEAVIHTAEIAKMRLYLIEVDGAQVQKVRADGIIIGTPTGSTSYAMSAGGPIVDPKVDAFLIVPIAPFKLSARPLVVPSSSSISITQMEPRRESVLVIDGQVEYPVTPDDVVKFSQEEIPAEFVRFKPHFYKSIEEKLNSQNII
jgi:NAD+ kinase